MKKMLGLFCFLVCLTSGCATFNPASEVFVPNYPRSPLYFQTISFERFVRPGNWESDKDWDKHVKDWSGYFLIGLYGMKGATYLEPNKPAPTSGLILRPYVTDIVRKYHVFLGGDDEIRLDVEFIDASNGKKVAHIQYAADSSGGLTGYKLAGFTFGGRIGACSEQAGYLLSRYISETIFSQK
jgi:hypothetical protein